MCRLSLQDNGGASSRAVTVQAGRLAPAQPEERQRYQATGHVEHAVSHGTGAILRERLMILIKDRLHRHEQYGEGRPAPAPRYRRTRPKCPQQEARQDRIFSEMRRFACQEVEQRILLIGHTRRQLTEHVPQHTTVCSAANVSVDNTNITAIQRSGGSQYLPTCQSHTCVD